MVHGNCNLIATSPPLIIRHMRLTNFSIAYVVDWTDSGIDERFSYGVHS